jgi:hypothetical protein
MPKRIQRKRIKGWRMPDGVIYVGRPTRYGNPYKVSELGESALTCYRKELEWYLSGEGCDPKHTERVKEDLRNLRGKDLACWCRLDSKCHADILLEFANR